ncbi:MAG: tetratricopeptide repeat protein [Myxococcales bacterium]|nr:tetratricopeptide repeat protein [Myxococcales bacterium]
MTWKLGKSTPRTARDVALISAERRSMAPSSFVSLVESPTAKKKLSPVTPATTVERTTVGRDLTITNINLTTGADPRCTGERETRWYPYPRTGSTRFVGRESQLEQLHAMLGRSQSAWITAQVRGMGGVGKTLLAIEYARRYAASWPGGIFWFDADPSWGTVTATREVLLARRHGLLATLAHAVGVEEVPGDLAATGGAVERAIDVVTGGTRYLWVIDNLPPGVTQEAVNVLLPPSDAGALLVTTRWRALERMGEPLDLDVLDPDAAYALLTARTPPRTAAEEASARALAKDVGYHPLALDVLGALVRTAMNEAPYAAWRERLKKPDTFEERAEALLEELPTGSEKSIVRVLASSLELCSATAIDILRVASVLGDAPIPRELLNAILEEHRDADEQVVETACEELEAHALVRRLDDGAGVEVHALVRRVGHLWGDDADSIAAAREAANRVLGSRFSEVDLRDVREHASLIELMPHALECSSPCESRDAAGLATSLGIFLGARGDFAGARERYARALAALERILGPEHPHTLTTLQNLAATLIAQGDLPGARERYKRALAARERILGPEHPDTLNTLQNLAGTLFAQGDLPGARERYKRALAARERILGPEHPDTQVTRFNLVRTLIDIDPTAATPHMQILERLMQRAPERHSAVERQIVRALPSLRARLR